MADRPIHLSGPMVRALLEGRKTQTRRVLNPQPTGYHDMQAGPVRRGDRLWVRETCAALEAHDGVDCIRYEADQVWIPVENSKEAGERWVEMHRYGKRRGASVPSIHMPRRASRLTLEVMDARVQRLQEITVGDAMAEGIGAVPEAFHNNGPCPVSDPDCLGSDGECHDACVPVDVRTAFSRLWDGLNAKRGFGWSVNPWVVAVSFEMRRGNIDKLQ